MTLDVRARIQRYIRIAVGSDINDEDDIFELGLVDSLFALELVTFVESEFGVVAEKEDLDICNFCSIAALVAFVEARCQNDEDAGRTWTSD
ncbi:MAG: acyl carrier protein [Alphaproteobacteria bacterium]|nr:acyl carrier protein [Alphaproteobacteria bacterium]